MVLLNYSFTRTTAAPFWVVSWTIGGQLSLIVASSPSWRSSGNRKTKEILDSGCFLTSAEKRTRKAISGIKFINLLADFLYIISVNHSFSVLTVCVCVFWAKGNWQKATRIINVSEIDYRWKALPRHRMSLHVVCWGRSNMTSRIIGY